MACDKHCTTQTTYLKYILTIGTVCQVRQGMPEGGGGVVCGDCIDCVCVFSALLALSMMDLYATLTQKPHRVAVETVSQFCTCRTTVNFHVIQLSHLLVSVCECVWLCVSVLVYVCAVRGNFQSICRTGKRPRARQKVFQIFIQMKQLPES